MKISVAQFAQGLLAATAGQSEADLKLLARNFVQLLIDRRETNKIDDILEQFTKLWEQSQGEIRVEVTSARPLIPAAKELLIEYLQTRTQAQTINLEEKVDAQILGGFVLRYDNKIVDGSLKNSLNSLHQQISQ